MRRVLGLTLALFVAVAASGNAVAQDTLKKIKDTGVVKIGNRDASIPLSYLDDKQKPVGYGVDICLKVVDAIKAELKMPNLKVEFVPVTSQTRIPILTGGNIDLECGSTTNSVERQKQVAFAPTYFMTGTKIIVKKNSGIKGYDDLKGKTVSVSTGGSLTYWLVREFSRQRGWGPTGIKTVALGVNPAQVAALKAGNV
ncbi:MAG TPA: transporter substrate-binding domain-containing protein, partial [Burkholderiales bacterium]|nr:transporter substrate-binding domain-containing protein [Burkholderiales bacterium]